ncbi:serine/threonine-protein kinase [Nannocystis radixulma]|uniref:Serine/threonine-protein kinase n=1 Tax=Nannocystis radixulma TaxID=2995305 RepID=A0ABT5BCE9_9BACT|nr:serine/threonine-protein kinase [Nannocystis radixulma]MDC0671123.1 serine/threonine-protein kinase [Nannocystis radixulma]
MKPELPPQSSPDPQVLARAQARLLAGLSRLGEEATEAGPPPTHVSWLGPQGDWEAGREPTPVAERYRFGAVFARGGLGAVRRAEDRKLGRTVAVKQLLRFDERAVQRFVREAAITARLQHPGIVPLYDLGRDEQGRPFLCMKLVEGASLEQRIGERSDLRGRLELVPHVIAAAEAIAYAHREGVIHRDLKPANILVGALGEAVVIDWGLAKDLSQGTDLPLDPDSGDGVISDLTAAGSLLGTLRYMPPEQARGDGVDARSDVYALGAVLYHVIAGVPPFHDRRSAQLVHDVLAGRPRPLAELVPAAPPALIAIVEKAMSPETGRRYAGAEALVDDLRRFQAGQLVGAHAYSAAEVGRLWLRRHRAAATVAAASVVALAAIGVVAFARVREARDVAEEQRAAAETAQGVAELRASEAEAARVTADRRAEDLLLAQARLAVEAQPSEVLPLLAQLRPDPARDGAVRALALAVAGPGTTGPAMQGPHDSLIGGIRLADGTWIGRTWQETWRWRPGAQEGEKLGEGTLLAATLDGRTWAQVRQLTRESAEVTVHAPDGAEPRRFTVKTAKPAAFYLWRLRPDGGVLWGWSVVGKPALELDLHTGEQRALPDADAPKAVAGLSLIGTHDGSRLAGLRDGRTLVVWDREAGTVDTERLACRFAINPSWTPDGRGFVASCHNEACRPEDESPACERVFAWTDGEVRVVEASYAVAARDALVFIAHRTGGTVAWAEDLARRRLWTRDVRTDRSESFVSMPYASPDGRVVSWGFGLATEVVEVASGTRIYSQQRSLVDNVVLGDDELLVHGPGGYRRMKATDAVWQSRWPAPDEPHSDGRMAPGGGWAVVRGEGRIMRVDLRSGAYEELPEACGPWNEHRQISAIGDDGRVLVVDVGKDVCLWGHGRSDIFELRHHSVPAVGLGPDRFAVGYADGELHEWFDGAEASRVLPVREHLHHLRYADDGSVLAALDGDGGVTVIDRAGAAKQLVRGSAADEQASERAALAFAPTGTRLALFRHGHATVEVVDVARGTTTPLAGAGTSKEESAFTPLRWSPTGQSVVVLDGDLLQAWSLARPEAPMQVSGLRGEDLAFLDERTLAVVGEDSAVVVVDVATGVHAPMRPATGGRVQPQLAAIDGGLMLLAGTGEVLQFTDRLPAAGAPLHAWLQGVTDSKDMF